MYVSCLSHTIGFCSTRIPYTVKSQNDGLKKNILYSENRIALFRDHTENRFAVRDFTIRIFKKMDTYFLRSLLVILFIFILCQIFFNKKYKYVKKILIIIITILLF